MDKKKLLLLAGALIIAVVTALGARSMFQGAAAPDASAAVTPQENLPMVVVAKRTLDTGTIIQPDSLTLQPWPKELMKEAYFIQEAGQNVNIETMAGRVVRVPIPAGQPVTKGSLVAPGDRGFLAAALGPGMRAVTIPVTRPTGVGGFVFPGDRVDVILTQNVAGVEGPPLKASETILKNLRVLATNQSTQPQKDEEGNIVATDIAMVTLEATPRIAEKITVAQSIGTISLSLRSLADSQGDLDRAIANGEIDIPEGLTPSEERAYIRKFRGSQAESGKSFVTGGDVSRFQRTTMPPQTESKKGGSNSPSGSGASASPDGSSQHNGPVVRVRRAGQVETYEF